MPFWRPYCVFERFLDQVDLIVAVSSLGFAQCSAETVDEGASHFQIGKPPAVRRFSFSGNLRASMSRLNMPRLMKIHNPSAQPEIQRVARNSKFNDVTIFTLVLVRLAFRNLNHFTSAATKLWPRRASRAPSSPVWYLSH